MDSFSDISSEESITDFFPYIRDETNNKVSDDFDFDQFNGEWNAFEHNISDTEEEICLANGVVSQVIADNQIVIDRQQIVFDQNNIRDLSVNDLVDVVVKSDDKVVVKPLRYKIMTGKITEYQKDSKRFIFCDRAFIQKTSSTQSLRVGDVIKCVVIETQNRDYNWRAYPYDKSCNTSTITENIIECYTQLLLKNKNGIEIDEKISFGNMRLKRKGTVWVRITNKGIKAQTLVSVVNEEGDNQIRFNPWSLDFPHVIQSGDSVYVELICETEYLGEHNDLIEFKFDGFIIGRFISVSVRDHKTRKNNINCLIWAGDTLNHFDRQIVIIRGEKPWNPCKRLFEMLESYDIPDQLLRAIENNWSLVETEDIFPELERPLNKFNYRKRFHALLYIEECENQLILNRYNLSGVRLRPEGRYIAITIPGLADGRPSLIVGDRVLALEEEKVTDERGIGFEGFIHEIRTEDILIRFSKQFHRDFSGGSFTVKFILSRTVIRRCHRALDLAVHMEERVLFPNNVLIQSPLKLIPIDSINWFNNSLNTRQRLAVVGALRGECRPTPYIIFGPPGTGKTVTIVEAILQVFWNLSNSRVIICTAANSSANLIAQKLLDSRLVTDKDMIRIKAFHRETPKELESITQIANEDPKKWLYHRIIVTTTSQAGIIFRHKLSSNHFTHAFVDEAAQVSEPESLIPIVLSAMGLGVVVLAGDHKQLGPVVFSQKAKRCGLNVSLMERLINSFKPYKKVEKFKKYGYYNPRFVVKLIDNYRTDEDIMRIPSKLFYENELIFNTQTDWTLIRSLDFENAVNFVAVKGQDMQGKDIPSWYNLEEVIEVYNCLLKLYNRGVDPKDIGIITPYRKQVMEIREYIRDKGLVECRVGTIEEFQGLEKRVIIVSMVRSAQLNLHHDNCYRLGFVHNPKRFNVAISRAMALIIVIGNPLLLSLDKNWSQFINYCKQLNSFYVPNMEYLL